MNAIWKNIIIISILRELLHNENLYCSLIQIAAFILNTVHLQAYLPSIDSGII